MSVLSHFIAPADYGSAFRLCYGQAGPPMLKWPGKFSGHCRSEGGHTMENIRISLNTVLPLFLTIGAGWLVKRRNIISAAAVREANALCFRLFMMVLLFYNIYTSDLGSSLNVPLLALCLGGTLLEFVLGLVLIPRIEASDPARGVMLQAFFRANTVLLGIPIAASLFGGESIGPISVTTAVIVPVFNVLAVIALELYRSGKPSARKIIRGVAANPLVNGAVLGIFFALTGLRLPAPVESAVAGLAQAATPLALLLMGASLDFSRLKSSMRSLAVCVAERVLIMPALFVSIAAALGFRGVELCAVLVVFGTPVAVNSYNMALQMDGDADLAGGIVLLSTAVSCLTLFLWIWLLKTLGLF